MKTFYILFFFLPSLLLAQVGIGTQNPDITAALDISSNSKGVLLPRLSTAERDAIVSPAAGLIIYNKTTNNLNIYNGTQWTTYVDGTSAQSSYVDLTNAQTIGGAKTFSNDIIPNGRMMLPMGELNFFNYNLGYTVSIPSYSTGASGNDNMVKINPSSGVNFVNDNFGTGSNTRLT